MKLSGKTSKYKYDNYPQYFTDKDQNIINIETYYFTKMHRDPQEVILACSHHITMYNSVNCI